jgi:hypothetical protein
MVQHKLDLSGNSNRQNFERSDQRCLAEWETAKRKVFHLLFLSKNKIKLLLSKRLTNNVRSKFWPGYRNSYKLTRLVMITIKIRYLNLKSEHKKFLRSFGNISPVYLWLVILKFWRVFQNNQTWRIFTKLIVTSLTTGYLTNTLYRVLSICYYSHIMIIVSDSCTINVS